MTYVELGSDMYKRSGSPRLILGPKPLSPLQPMMAVTMLKVALLVIESLNGK